MCVRPLQWDSVQLAVRKVTRPLSFFIGGVACETNIVIVCTYPGKHVRTHTAKKGIVIITDCVLLLIQTSEQKLWKSGGEFISSYMINLSAHSHTILSIVCDKASNCFTLLQQNDKVSVGMTILLLLCTHVMLSLHSPVLARYKCTCS